MTETDIAQLPGYRRRFRITPAENRVQAELEDDMHCMSVIVYHDGRVATRVEPDMRRQPWTTCPGAQAKLEETFTGVALDEFPLCGEKRTNCTHLHDLATLAAAHAYDDKPLIYDIVVSDPVDGIRQAEIRCNGELLLGWSDSRYKIVSPPEVAGFALNKLRDWIETLEPELQEPARLLQWGSIVAHGRTIPYENQSDASKMPPTCYTFQPEQAGRATRVGEVRDFSRGDRQPLDGYKPQV